MSRRGSGLLAGRRRPEHDPGAGHGDPVGPGEHGVEHQRADLRQVVGQPVEPQREVLQGVELHRGLAAVAGQQRCRPRFADQLGRVDGGQRDRPVGAVAEQLGGHPREAERQQRPERRVVEQGEGARGAGRAHLLHEHLVAARRLRQVRERLPGPLVGDDHQPYPGAVDAVAPLLGGRLDRHREAQLARGRDGVGRAADPPERQHLDAVAAQQGDAARRRRARARPPAPSLALDQRPRALHVDPGGPHVSRRPARVRQRA